MIFLCRGCCAVARALPIRCPFVHGLPLSPASQTPRRNKDRTHSHMIEQITVEAKVDVLNLLYPLSQDEEVDLAVTIFRHLASRAQFVSTLRDELLDEMDPEDISCYLLSHG